jgi:tetraacyldisaccharide 4'-kinase
MAYQVFDRKFVLCYFALISAKDIENLSQRNNSGTGSFLSLLRWILSPLAGLYWMLTAFRNHLFDIEYKKSLEFTPFIISVGNLSVGGTGKSPMIEYLAEMLGRHYSLAILSRGYRRKTSGVRLAGPSDNADTLGDEPYQFYRKFGRSGKNQQKIVVAVGEERALAIPEILHQHPEVQLILLDDAFQHRQVKADLQLLLTTCQRPFFHDRILPLGLLRESRKGASRADMVVVTKCPEKAEAHMNTSRQKAQRYAGDKVPVYFSGIRYGKALSAFEGENPMPEPVLLISGLANADLFDAYARQQFKVTDHIRWGDHHRYTESDAGRVAESMTVTGAKAVLTTEKDMVKLMSEAWRKIPLFYLPICVTFIEHEAEFQQFIINRIRSSEKV